MKNVKVEWCKNFIKAVFRKHVPEGGGIYTECSGARPYQLGLKSSLTKAWKTGMIIPEIRQAQKWD